MRKTYKLFIVEKKNPMYFFYWFLASYGPACSGHWRRSNRDQIENCRYIYFGLLTCVSYKHYSMLLEIYSEPRAVAPDRKASEPETACVWSHGSDATYLRHHLKLRTKDQRHSSLNPQQAMPPPTLRGKALVTKLFKHDSSDVTTWTCHIWN